MPSAYSQDLREKVMQKIISGEWTQREASRHFSISERTLRRWVSRWKQEGNYTRKPNHTRQSHIQDLDHFRERVLSSPDQTLEELAEIYETSRSTIHRTMQRAKISYKKNVSLPREERRRASEVSRSARDDSLGESSLHG